MPGDPFNSPSNASCDATSERHDYTGTTPGMTKIAHVGQSRTICPDGCHANLRDTDQLAERPKPSTATMALA